MGGRYPRRRTHADARIAANALHEKVRDKVRIDRDFRAGESRADDGGIEMPARFALAQPANAMGVAAPEIVGPGKAGRLADRVAIIIAA